MAPIKRRPHARSHHKMKLRRKPNISKLVYKFLSLERGRGQQIGETLQNYIGPKCSICKRFKRREEASNSQDSQPGGNMANKRKESARNSKIHRVKRRQTSRDQTLSSCMHKGSGGEGIKKMKKYIQKAINFGVESGYLIPKDTAYKVLQVSSDLMNDSSYINKGRDVSQVRDRSPRHTPIRFEDYEVQDARRRRRRKGRRRRRRSRRRRRRSRSGSRRRRRSHRRRRGRRRDGTDGEEVVENEDDYEFNNQNEKRKSPETVNRNDENERMNQSDEEKTIDKKEDDGSDLSIDEDETEDEDEKKREDTNK